MMEQDAAPAGVPRKRAPGRPWPPVRRHDDRLPSNGLYAVGTKAGGSPPDKVLTMSALRSIRKLRHQGLKSRDGAPRGAAHRKRCVHEGYGCADRRAVPSHFAGVDSPWPPGRGQGKTGLPGASTKNTGDGACLGKCCLTIESVKRTRVFSASS
jgi:hypothetical protein